MSTNTLKMHRFMPRLDVPSKRLKAAFRRIGGPSLKAFARGSGAMGEAWLDGKSATPLHHAPPVPTRQPATRTAIQGHHKDPIDPHVAQGCMFGT